MSSLTPASSILRRIRTSGSSTSFSRSVRPRPRISSRCQLASACSEHGVAGGRILDVGGQAALLAQLAERVAAARRLEQVGGDLGVVGEGRRHRPKRLGVVGDGRPRADRGDQLLRAVGPAGHNLSGALDRRRTASPRRPRTALPRAPPAPGPPPPPPCAAAAPRPPADPSRTRAVSERSASGAGRGRVGRAERLLEAPQRLAQLEAPEHVAQPRAVGVGRDELRELELERDVALGGRELLGEPRVLGVVDQVLLALGAADLVDVVEHLLQRAEPLQQLGRGLVADPGDAGDVVAGVALEPDEVRDQLGRDRRSGRSRRRGRRRACR